MLFNLFKKDKEKPNSGNKFLTLRIRETIKESPDTLSVYFEQPEPFLEYQAGQFLTLILEINGKEERRSYSLCTSPFTDPFPGITVKRLAGGLVSNYINDNFKPGKGVTVMKPLGNFTSNYHSENKRHYGMFAGGSGITPIMGIVKSIMINEPLSKVHLLYCSRSEEMIIFKEALQNLQAEYPGRLEIIHNLTQPGQEWTGLTGRLDGGTIHQLFKENFNLPSFEERFFVCGPQGLMNVVQNSLVKLGVPEENVFNEQFFIENAEEEKDDDMEEPIISRPVTVLLEGQEYTFDVGPDKTILEAGLDEEIDMPYSCQSGLCTACRGRLISGEVKMNEDAGLTEEEISEGYILCCSSKPSGPDLRIQIE